MSAIPCGCPPADRWESEIARLCTAAPGELAPVYAYYEALCPPENGCTDGLAHRSRDANWHTATGGTISGWHASHRPEPAQMPLFEVSR